MPDIVRTAFLGVDHPHGAGWREILAALEDRLTVSAIMPGFGGATTSLEERYVHLPSFDSVDALIAAGDFEAAVVCLPDIEASDAVERLACAGKHVLLEKPGAMDREAAKQMATAVDASEIAFQNGYLWRYDEGADRLKSMIAEGRFGKLAAITMHYFTSDVAHRGPDHYVFDAQQSGGGFFQWLACHWLDLVMYIVARPVVGVTARVGVHGATGVDVEDGGTAILEFDGGPSATFTGGYWIPRWSGESGFAFYGEKRWVHWRTDQAGTSGVLEIHGPKPQWNAMEEVFTLPPDSTPGYGGKRAMAAVTDWLDAVHAKPQKQVRNTAASTAAVLELIDCIYESSRSGKRVECQISGT